MSKRLFEDYDHAVLYKQYRPSYPVELIERIIGYLKEKSEEPFDLAVDVGCGTGQATKQLAKYFRQVNGYDVSENQIEQAIESLEDEFKNVRFYTSQSESLTNLNGSTVDLVVVANAIHWFDFDLFFTECHRILKENGVLAFFTRQQVTIVYEDIGEQLTVRRKQFREALIPFENETLHHPRSGYEEIKPPFKEVIRDHSLKHNFYWTLNDMVNNIQTWSFYRNYKAKNPDGTLLEEFLSNMRDILKQTRSSNANLDSIEMLFQYKVDLVMCRGKNIK